MASPKPVMFQINEELVLAAGRYVKVSENRVGTAYLEIDNEGNLSYVNRRGESVAITLAAFASRYSNGLNTPMETATVATRTTKAPRAV